jgi:hypothetical protein
VEGGFGPLFHLPASVAHLVRHPDSRDAVRGIAVRMERMPAGLRHRYELDADLERLRVPQAGPVRPGDRLWQHTCFEIFVSARMPAYQEFNFSPSGERAAYAFRRYREGVPTLAKAEALQVGRNPKLTLEATIPLDPGPARVALAAVVESTDGALSYWALRHPAGKPDFHHPDAFAFDLDEIRN